MLGGFLSGSDAVGWGAQLVVQTPHFSEGTSLAAEISLWHFSCHPWESSQLYLLSSALPTTYIVLECFLLSVCVYEASLQLLFSWLFKMISPQFSCNFKLVQGGGYCSFQLLLHHLGSPIQMGS